MTTTAPVATTPNISVEDRIAIHDLVAAYSWRCDTKDFDGISALFAEDGVWDEQVLGAPRCEGREAVHGLFHALNDAEIPLAVHMISNERISEGDENSAKGTCHLRTYGSVNGTPLDVIGYYDDAYVKIDGQWLFASRTLVGFTPPQKVM
jgi:ketosteroid isomerase-like protein